MTERRILQLTLDDRDAEALCGAIAVASIIMQGKAAVGLALGGPEPETTIAVAFPRKSIERLICGMAIATGVSCPVHEGKVSHNEAKAGQQDCAARYGRLYHQLADFVGSYRTDKIYHVQSNLNEQTKGGE